MPVMACDPIYCWSATHCWHSLWLHTIPTSRATSHPPMPSLKTQPPSFSSSCIRKSRGQAGHWGDLQDVRGISAIASQSTPGTVRKILVSQVTKGQHLKVVESSLQGVCEKTVPHLSILINVLYVDKHRIQNFEVHIAHPKHACDLRFFLSPGHHHHHSIHHHPGYPHLMLPFFADYHEIHQLTPTTPPGQPPMPPAMMAPHFPEDGDHLLPARPTTKQG